MEIKDLAGFSEPLKRLIEVISEGLGAISKPYLTRKNAEAKAYEISLIGNAIAEQNSLLGHTKYADGAITIKRNGDKPAQELSLTDRAAERLQYQEAKVQQNIESVFSNAAEELSRETEVPEEKPQAEWVYRFIDISKGISTEDLQNLWGRVLAGEIRKPGSFSLRTLDVLRNLSKHEAETFVKLGNYALKSNDKVFFVDPEDYIYKKDGEPKFEEVLSLRDAGLIYVNDLEFSFSPLKAGQKSSLMYGPYILIFDREKDTESIPCNVGVLTKVGKELFQLIQIEPDIEYMKFVGTKFKAEGVKFSWATITGIYGGKVHFADVKTPQDTD